ncbi:hypothetical protein RJT34_19980 [Clitoria ternatea]|uniref:Uncharacterized protein n=1 Tax=Clitoria ternatea TaxID=43366 RepID=A0AAN9IS05_CLITE
MNQSLETNRNLSHLLWDARFLIPRFVDRAVIFEEDKNRYIESNPMAIYSAMEMFGLCVASISLYVDDYFGAQEKALEKLNKEKEVVVTQLQEGLRMAKEMLALREKLKETEQALKIAQFR